MSFLYVIGIILRMSSTSTIISKDQGPEGRCPRHDRAIDPFSWSIFKNNERLTPNKQQFFLYFRTVAIFVFCFATICIIMILSLLLFK